MTLQRSRLWGYAVFLVVMLVMYVLSMAPMLWVAIHVGSQPGRDWEWPMQVHRTVYAPMYHVAENSPRARWAIVYYAYLWGLTGVQHIHCLR